MIKMELKIVSKEDNKLLSRTEIEGVIKFEGPTPTRKEIVKELAKQLNAKPELIIVREIKTEFGDTSAKIEAYLYEKREVLEKVEVKRMIEKHDFPADEPKAEEKEGSEGEQKEEAGEEKAEAKEEAEAEAEAGSEEKKE